MESFRKFVQGWLGRTFLVIVLVIFVVMMFWDTSAAPGARGELVEVNGKPIFKGELDQAYEAELNKYGQQLDRRVLEQFIKRDDVLERLIRQEVLVGTARDLGVVADAKLIDDTIRAIPAFQDESGQFSQTQFRSAILNNGFANAAAFRDRVEASLLAEQLQGSLQDSAFATRQELELLTRIGEQKRDFAWAVISPSAWAHSVSVTDEEVQTRYERDAKSFMTPEQFSIDYIELKLEDYAAEQKVDPAAVKARYDDMVAKAAGNAERRVAHILISLKDRTEADARARADEVLALLAKGESFAALAATWSDDAGSKAGGGDLGYLGRGTLDPALDAALANLRVNDVSPAIKSPDGLHLLKVLDIREVEMPSFDSVRGELADALKREQARSRFDDLARDLASAAYESDNLQDVAAKLSLQVRSTGLFGRQGGPGIAGNRKVLDEVFSADVLEDGRNSGVVDMADGHVAVVHIKEHLKPERRPLAEVSTDIKAVLMREKASAVAREKTGAMLAAVTAGQALDVLAKEAGVQVQRVAAAQRSTQGIPADILRAGFKASRPAAGAVSAVSVALPDGAHAVVTVANAVDGSLLGVADTEVATRRVQLGREFGRLEFVAFIDEALARAEVVRPKNAGGTDEPAPAAPPATN